MNINLKVRGVGSLKIIAMCCLFWLALAAWSIALPVGVSPDEDFHQTMIYCAAKNDARCLDEGKRVGHCYSMYPFVAANCSRDSHLRFPAANKVDWTAYPPLYFKTMNLLVGDTLGNTTRNVRLANISIALALAIFSVFLSHANIRRPIAIAWVICSVPVGIFYISSINPTAWSIMSVAALWGPLLTLISRSQNNFSISAGGIKLDILRAVFIFIVLAIGLGSRSESYVFMPIIFLIAAIYWLLGTRINWKSVIKIALALMSIFAVVFFLILLFNQPLLKAQMLSNNSLGLLIKNYFLHPNWKTFQMTSNTLLGTLSLTGIPGSELGTHDVPTPASASFFITTAFCGSFLLGLAYIDRKKGACLTILMLTIFFIVSLLWSAATWDLYQSRYFLPTLYPILGFALLPTAKTSIVFNYLQWLIIFLSTALANSLMLLSAELRFIYGVVFETTRYPLNREIHDINPVRLFIADVPNWWLGPDYLSPFLLWALGSMFFLGAVICLLQWVVEPQPYEMEAFNSKAN